MGPVSLRAPVGHRPRGLQRFGQRLGLFQPRSGAFAGVSLGRGRARRHLRRPPAAVLRPGPVERPGPDPQGAAVRADQQRREPRRGRQGVLLLPRLDADALVHEVPLQVPAGGLPVRRPRGDEPPTGPARLRVRAARHGRVRPGSLLRRVRRVREGVAGGRPRPGHRVESRSRAGCAARAADAVVSEHLVVGRGCPPAGAAAGRGRRERRDRRGRTRTSASGFSPAKARRRYSSPRTRPTRNASSGAPTGPPTSRTGSTTISSMAVGRP